MLRDFEVADWFAERDLLPGDHRILSVMEYVETRFDAYALDEAFDLFVREIIVPIAYRQFFLNAETWEELYSDYISFMVDVKRHKGLLQ